MISLIRKMAPRNGDIHRGSRKRGNLLLTTTISKANWFINTYIVLFWKGYYEFSRTQFGKLVNTRVIITLYVQL